MTENAAEFVTDLVTDLAIVAVAAPKRKAKNTTVETTTTVDPIEAAKAAVTVPTTDPNRQRALRDAAIDAAVLAYGPFTILEVVSLPNTEPKFKAWITGARGRNGLKIALADGRIAVTGVTTVADFAARGAVTNVDAFTSALVKTEAATMVGIIG